MKETLNLEFEKAVRFIAKHLPISDEKSRKPILFHDIRVGVYLYEKGYKQDVIIAGILHDAIEWSHIGEQALREEFGDNVTRLVQASTKDNSIADKEQKTIELIKCCVQSSQDALIVKAADTIDSFKWYSNQGNKEQLHHCMKTANAILEFKPNDFDDKIFEELKKLTGSILITNNK